MIGRGGMQSITHFLNFAAQENNLKDKKWSLSSPSMVYREGMGEFHFSPNYSMLHAYDLAFNQEMDANLRKEQWSAYLNLILSNEIAS